MRCAKASGLLVVALAMLAACAPSVAEHPALDRPLCPSWIEGMLFDSYRDLANRQGRPEKRWPGVAFEERTFAAKDGTAIYGYRAFADSEAPQPQPALVIVPGNAMLADQLAPFAAWFALQGFTAYIFDYRGYGGSAGIPRSNALISDGREILARVAGQGHPDLYVYAMSFGGVVSLAALAQAERPAAMVVDGTPSKLPWYAFCPDWLDPVNTLAYAPERTLVVSGSEDPVVTPDQMAPLRARAEELGMASRVVPDFSHPGLDDPQTTLERLSLVRDFLTNPHP